MNLTPQQFKPIFDEGLKKVRLPYEVMRLQTVPLVNVHLPKNKQIKDHKRMFYFPWDGEYHQKKVDDFMTKEIDWDALDKKYARKNAKE